MGIYYNENDPFAAEWLRQLIAAGEMVKRVFGTGQTVSEAICTRYGFDPNEEIRPFTWSTV